MARVRKEPAKKAKKQAKPTKKRGIVAKVFSFIKKVFVVVLKPFRFFLKPFQNNFFRAIGRFLKKVLLINYFASSWQEVKKVEWPNRKETIKLTLAVFVFAIALGVFVSVIDFGLDKLFKEVIL